MISSVAEAVTTAAIAAGEEGAKPFFPRTTKRAVKFANRGAAMAPDFEEIDAAMTALQSTSLGRAIFRAVSGGMSVAAGVSINVVAGAAGVPATGDIKAAGVSILSVMIGRWLYARSRKVDPSLPPLPPRSSDEHDRFNPS